MRVPIPHSLPKEEVRRRLRDNIGDLKNYVPGGMAQVTSEWPSEDRMKLGVTAMMQQIDGMIEIEDSQVVFVIALPPMLSFVEPVVESAIRSNAPKLLGPPKAD